MLVTTQQGDWTVARTNTLGCVTEVLLQTPRSSFRLSSLKYWVQPAIDLRQIQVFYDASFAPVGFVTWAYVGDELLEQLQSTDVLALHLSEWNEGLNLWIVDFVALNGHAFSIGRWMRKSMFKDSDQAFGARGEVGDASRRLCRFRRSTSNRRGTTA